MEGKNEKRFMNEIHDAYNLRKAGSEGRTGGVKKNVDRIIEIFHKTNL